MHRSEERAARNEVAFREANEKIDSKRRELGIGARTPYLCECEDESCTDLIHLTVDEYRSVRSRPRRFVVTPGHEHRDQLLTQREDYSIVEKSGAGGRIAEKAGD